MTVNYTIRREADNWKSYSLKRARRSAIGNRQLAIGNRKGFTLIELTVVIAMMAFLAMMALPSAIALMQSGQDSQAYNVMSAALTMARASAIENGRYAVVRVQPAIAPRWNQTTTKWTWKDEDGYWNRLPQGLTWVAVFLYNEQEDKFDAAPGTAPKAVPGQFLFGEVSDTFVNGSDFNDKALLSSDDDIKKFTGEEPGADCQFNNFTAFNVIFSPSGSVVRAIPGMTKDDFAVRLRGNAAFTSSLDFLLAEYSSDPAKPKSAALFCEDLVAAEGGVSAMTMFDYAAYRRVPQVERLEFLNKNAQLIPLNVNTGQLFPRK